MHGGDDPILFQTEPLERAVFLERPNRFTVRFCRNGRKGRGFLTNSGRLGEILIPGTEILIAPRPHTRLRWEVVGATWSRRWPGDRRRSVFLNTGQVNRIAERLIEKKCIPPLAGYRIARREFTWGSSRIDFLLVRRGEGGTPGDAGRSHYLLEVKSVTLVEQGLAFFPDARTDRGRRHLEELYRARARSGCRAGVLFLVQGEADRFLPDFNNDLEFARTFRSVSEGVDFFPYRVNPVLTEEGRLSFEGRPRQLSIPAALLHGGLSDSGVYLLSLRLPASRIIPVGGLGRRLFRKGHYVYIGSARRALSRRIDRHLRLRKRHHYHIDFLRARASEVKAFPIRAAPVGECELAREVEGISAGEVPGFGCSDCNCRSHLFYFPEAPFRTAAFQELLIRLRHRPLA